VLLSAEVSTALAEHRPVVALETSIVGQGLPPPYNLRAARDCEAAIRSEGAVPATLAVIDGRLRAGLSDEDLERIAAGATKVSSRDLGPALVRRSLGATTVAATMRIASMVGIRFLATGGIGGVHRGHPEDVSADLEELGRTPVAVFCAGAKIILDLSSTLERLDSLAVPVLGFGTSVFPAFYTKQSEGRVSARVDSAQEAAEMIHAAWSSGSRGIVVAVPPPTDLEGAQEIADQAVLELTGVAGGEVTPKLLARMAELSDGRSVALNVSLVVNNASIAARVARAFAHLPA